MFKKIWELENAIQSHKKQEFFQGNNRALFWNSLLDVGTNIAIRSADSNDIKQIWTEQLFFINLTIEDITVEVRDGLFDEVLLQLKSELSGMPREERNSIYESFLLQHHAKYLSNYFDTYVMVGVPERHCATPLQIEEYVTDSFRFGGERIISEIPYTVAGLIAGQRLRKEGIPIALSCAYSSRQHNLIHLLRLSDISIFDMTRIFQFFEFNQLGSENEVTQKIAITIQNGKEKYTKEKGYDSHVFVTGLNSYLQLCELGGCDSIDMTPFEALSTKEKLAPGIESSLQKVNFIAKCPLANFKKSNLSRLWELTKEEEDYFLSLSASGTVPNVEVLLSQSNSVCSQSLGIRDPRFCKRLVPIGAIPKYANWRRPIVTKKVDLDSLLTSTAIQARHQLQKKFRRAIVARLKVI